MKLEKDNVDWYYGGSLWSHEFLIPEIFDYSEESINKLCNDFAEDLKMQIMVLCGYGMIDNKWEKFPDLENQMKKRLQESRKKNGVI